MYNGIGLTSARGSATSGHVTKNLSHVKPNFYREKIQQNTGKQTNSSEIDIQAEVNRKGNTDILDHKRKRDLEAQVYQLEEELRDEGCSDEEIEHRSKELRKRLSSRNYSSMQSNSKISSTMDSHEMLRRKEVENKKMKDAFGIQDKKLS